MSPRRAGLVLACAALGALVTSLTFAPLGGCATTPRDGGGASRSRAASVGPQADLVLAPFEDASGVAADADLPLALRFELAERLSWASGIAFVHPLEAARPTDPDLLPLAADAPTLRGRWDGRALVLVLADADGAVRWTDRYPLARIADAARDVARALGLEVAPDGLALPAPSDARGLGAALRAYERAETGVEAPDAAWSTRAPQDAWGLTLVAHLSLPEDADVQRARLDAALALAPGLLAARLARAHWLADDTAELTSAHVLAHEKARVDALQALLAVSPRLPRFTSALAEVTLDGIQMCTVGDDLGHALLRGGQVPAAIREGLPRALALWEIAERLPLSDAARGHALARVAAASLAAGDAPTALGRLTEARVLPLDVSPRNLALALTHLTLHMLGASPEADAPITFSEVHDYAALAAAVPGAVPDLTARDCSGATPLIVAAERGDAALVERLLAAGADPRATNLRGQTALHRAAALGHDAVVERLVATGDPQVLDAVDRFGATAIAEAVRADRIGALRRLVAGGAHVGVPDSEGATPLHLAARFGRNAAIPILVRAGADLEERDDEGATPLSRALVADRASTLDALVRAGAAIGPDALVAAARTGRPPLLDRVVAWLAMRLPSGAQVDLEPALTAALAADDVVMVQHLAARGARAAHGRSVLEAAIVQGALGVTRTLATPEARRTRGRHGLRPLELALVQPLPNAFIVKSLAEPGDAAAWAWLGDIAALTAALDADPEAARRVGPDGLAALHHAVRGGRLAAVELLLARGAPPGLLTAPLISHAPEIEGWTPLHFAIAANQIAIVRLLIGAGAEVDAIDTHGRTARSLSQLPWIDARLRKELGTIGTAGVEPESKNEESPAMFLVERARVVLQDMYLPLASEGWAPIEPAPADAADGFGFAGRGIQLPIRIADTTLLFREAADGRDDSGTPWAGLEHVTARCYRVAAWPEAARAARDLVRGRRLEDHAPLVRALAEQNLAVLEVRLGDPAAARARFDGAIAAYAAVTAGPLAALLAAMLENRSEVAWRSEQWPEAIADLERARALRERHDQDPRLLPVPWLLLGMVHGERGHYREAVKATRTGLELAEQTWGASHPVVILARGNLAVLLDALGDRAGARALTFAQLAQLEQAGAEADPVQLAIAEANVAIFLSQAGDVLGAQARATSAATRLQAHDPDHFLLGRVLLVVGDVVAGLDPDAAEAAYREAATRLGRAYGEASGAVAGALRRLAGVVFRRDAAAGRALLMDAWVIASQADTPEERWPIELALGRDAARAGRMAAAIFFGKQAVGTLEGIRAAARGLGPALEASLVESRITVWHELAGWLVAEGRLEEATRVLALLKDDEVASLTTRGGRTSAVAAGANTPTTATTLPETATEGRIRALANKQSEELVRAGAALERLEEKKRERPPDPADDRKIVKIRDQVREARRRFEQFLSEIDAALATMDARRAAEIGAMNLRDASALQGTLGELGHGAVLIHYLAVDDKLRIVVTTPKGQIGRVADVTTAALNELVFGFRQALSDPRSDPRPLAEELFRLLIAPIEGDLREAGAETLMVALDGALRYVPLAALWDGERWLVERYRLATFSRAGLDKLTARPLRAGRLAGLGVGKKIDGFSQLSEVPRELEGIVRRDGADPDGVVPGDVWMDEAFSRDRLAELLESRAFAAVHIASHFVFEPGTESDSYLLLGDGGRLTLEDIRYELRFDGVDLLSLSACNTAVGAGADAGEGREIEGFAALTQRLGAKGVLATLWPVADRSTGELMRALYAIREGDANVTKADALRQAQLRFIRGKDVLDPADLTPRGPRPLVGPDEGDPTGPALTPAPVDRAHPYYWAPFVLIGNWL